MNGVIIGDQQGFLSTSILNTIEKLFHVLVVEFCVYVVWGVRVIFTWTMRYLRTHQ